MTEDRYILASNEFCSDVNPTLWNVFCALTNRPVGMPTQLWTEQAVVEVLLSRGLKPPVKQYLDEVR